MRFLIHRRRFLALLALCLGSLAALPSAAKPRPSVGETYLALGDSVAFGYTISQTTPASYGDQGYVKPFADWLGAQHGGVRPTVVNLAVPGETSGTFFRGGQLGEFLNRNYTRPPAVKQYNLCLQRLAKERKARRVVSVITVQLGANDLAALITPAFVQKPQAEQDAIITAALTQLKSNYSRLLGKLHAALPTTKTYLLGYYNPLAATPDDPLHPIFNRYIPQLNAAIAAEAAAHQVRFVDLNAAFSGHEGEWTYIVGRGFPDGIHPNASGYAVIAEQLEAAASS